MSLTVPQSNARPGRAPEIRVEADRTGEAVARLGGAMKGLGDRYVADFVEREGGKLEAGFAGDLTRLRREFEETGDPTTIDRDWGGRVSALKTQYMQSAQARAGSDNLAQHLMGPVGDSFDLVAARHASALGVRSVAMRATEGMQSLDAFDETMADTWDDGDTGLRDMAEQAQGASVDQAVRAGLLTPEAGEARKMQWRARVENVALRALAEGDPPVFSERAADPADDLALRLADDGDARRLASARGFVADTPEAVARMADDLARMDALPEAERTVWLDREVQQALGKRRAGLGRPMFHTGGPLEAAGLQAVAQRLLAARRSGKIDDATFAREATRLRAISGTFDG